VNDLEEHAARRAAGAERGEACPDCGRERAGRPTLDALAALLAPGPASEVRARALLCARSLPALARMSAAALECDGGLERPAAERVVAAFTLARGLAAARLPRRPALRTPRRVFEVVRMRLLGVEEERFLALLVDGKHRLQRVVTVSIGTLSSSIVHPREVFRAAVREAASAVIVVHNHPSGDPEPSAEDLAVTRRLSAAGRLVGIPLLDHLVVGDGRFVSLRERMDFDRA
jgi:DNA repair protein RadC